MTINHCVFCLVLLASPALADLPVAAATSDRDPASNSEAVVVDIADLGKIHYLHDEADADTEKQPSPANPEAADPAPLTEVIELDAAPLRVVNRSRHFRIISRNAPAEPLSTPPPPQPTTEH